MAAPIGNLFALGNNGGRPRKYKTVEEMAIKIAEYFNSFTPSEEPVLGTRPTVTGLALFLGFADRKSLYEYRDNYDEFRSLIKKALTLVEMEYEEMLASKAATGAIFALKNMDWKDKSEQDVNMSGQLNIPITKWADDSEKQEV